MKVSWKLSSFRMCWKDLDIDVGLQNDYLYFLESFHEVYKYISQKVGKGTLYTSDGVLL